MTCGGVRLATRGQRRLVAPGKPTIAPPYNPAHTSMSLAANTRLDNYEIIRPLGAGGMGEVYLARDTSLNRTVAIKILPADVTSDPHRVARFEQEARAASALNHPNVSTIHTLGRTEDGRRYIAMELVEGETLRAQLTRGRFELRRALDVAIQIASALTASHAAGIVHRDIKPENVMVRGDRLVKVLDFGLAKLTASGLAVAAHEATRTMHATEPGSLVGTIGYMSPEQARGDDVDARSDVWALGVVLYEMVSGRAPFTGATRSDVLVAILDREPTPLAQLHPDVPAELQRIVRKCLRKDANDRYQVIQDLLLDLQALREDLPSASSSGAAAGIGTGQRASRFPVPMAVLLLVLLIVAGGMYWWLRREPARSTRQPGSPTGSLTRLTFDPGLQTDVAFSPDGRFIAYASDKDGNFDIWVQPVDGKGSARRVTDSPASDTQPAWSPDGNSIVFRSERDGGGLFIVPVFGGAERQVTNFGVVPQWLSNENQIFFRGGVDDYYSNAYLVSPDGGEAPREVAADFLQHGTWNWIAPHPDGRISAIGLHPKRRFGFFTVGRDGRSVTPSSIPADFPLRFTETGTRASRFQWNAGGNAIFVEAAQNEVRNIWKVDVDPDTLNWLQARRLTVGSGPDTAAALSGDGGNIAYTSLRQAVRLWAFPFNASQGRIGGPPSAITPEHGVVESFSLSPDGRRLSYDFRAPGAKRWEMLLKELDTGKTEVFAVNAAAGVWSFDSKTLAYNLSRPELPPPGEWALAVRSLGGPERIIKGWSKTDVALAQGWTPDGQHILSCYIAPLYTGQARLALWPATFAPPGSQRILVSDPDNQLWQPSFSPNGRWLVFLAEPRARHMNPTIFVTPAAGAPRPQWTRIVGGKHWVDKPRWAPDGRALYFVSNQGSSFYNLWGVRFDPEAGHPVGEPFAVTKFDSPGFILSPRVTAAELGIAADRAVLTMTTVTGSIWMIEGVDR